MANSDKDILITPNSGSSTVDPKIEYVGADSSANDTITVETQFDGTKTTLSFEGSAGQLFSISNDLSDTIFAVNDVSGIPSIEVDSDGEIRLAEFSGNVGIGISSPTELLHVDGTIKANNLTLSSLSAQNSEATSIMIDGSGIIGTRELGSNAFNSTAFLTSSSLSGYATETYVNTQVSNLVDSSPAALNTLNELAAALGDDANFSTTVTNSIATKAPIASPSFTTKITTPQIHHTSTISVLNGSSAQGMKVASLYVGTSYSNSAASGQVNTLNGYRVQGAEVINSSGNWVGGGNISEFTNNSGYITGNQTITLSGDVSGSGTTSISVTVADDSHNHIISNVDGLQTALDGKAPSSTTTTANAALPKAGGTMTGGITSTAGGDAITISNESPQIRFNDTTSGADDFWIHVNSNIFYVLGDRDDSGSWETPHPLELHSGTNIGYTFGSRLFTEAYHPNADTLTTARTINGVSFNGSANITVADTTKLPLAGGTMSGTITGRDFKPQAGYHLQRSDHHSGHLEGSYNNVGENSYKSNPIYTIGSSYNPGDAALSNMYGVGYSHTNASFINFTGGSGWGFYVAADGDARVWLDGSTGVVSSTGQHYVGSSVVWNAGNDGAGSGLDADLLDGQQGSYYYSAANPPPTTGFVTLSGSNSFTNSYNEFGNSTGSVSNDGSWNARINIAGSSHARLDVKSVSDGIITSMYSHTGQAAGKIGTMSNHALHLMINGTAKAVLSTAGSLSTTPQGTLWGASNDGSGSGLDADTLDGVNSASFARVDAGSTYTNYGNIQRFYSNTNMATASGSQASLECFSNGSGNDAFMTFHVGSDYAIYLGLDGGTNKLSTGGWSAGAASYEIYHAGNLPSLATLGYTGATNANYITNNNQLTNGAGYTTVDTRAYNSTNSYIGGYYVNGTTGQKPNNSKMNAGKLTYSMQSSSNLGFGGSWNDVLWMSSYTGGDVKKSVAIVSSKYDNTNLWVAKQDYDSASWGTGYLLWNAGNDGSGSGLDADLLDGLDVHNTQGTQNTANTILRTQANGYAMLGWINTTSGVASGTPTRIYCSQDAYIRYYTPASLAPYILNQGSTKNAHVHDYLPLTGGTVTGNTNFTGGLQIEGSQIWNGSDTWCRIPGATGVYFSTYAGGVYMEDTTWVRIYNSKALYVANQIAASGNITAYYSDERLKTKTGKIENALEKVQSLSGFTYVENELARSLGYVNENEQVALSAQDVKKVMPQAVSLAPCDMKTDELTGVITSKSGEDYLTIDYARLVPLLVESIKEQQELINKLTSRLDDIEKGE